MPATDTLVATASTGRPQTGLPPANALAAVATNATTAALVACHECDLLQQEAILRPKGVALCRRCGAHLYRDTPNSLDRALACILASIVLFCLANAFPLISLELQGGRTTTSLLGAVMTLYRQEIWPVALLVFITTLLVPAIELITMLYLLLPLRLGIRPAGLSAVFRFVEYARPWGMVEVFMLGVLVSVVKLANFATVEPGVALWSFAGLMLLMSATAHAFNPRDFWARVAQVP